MKVEILRTDTHDRRKRMALKTEDGEKYLLEFYYQLGGRSYFSGREHKRGYCVSVQPGTIKASQVTRGAVISSSSPMRGIMTCVKEVNRFSKSTFENLALTYFDTENETAQRLLEKVHAGS